MEEVRNSQGKLVCRVDKSSKTVEIVLKGCTTLICFSDDGKISVINKDTETNLYYLESRYYDSVTGRFITIDSINYADSQTLNGLNLYAYCGNNPIINVDPSGTSTQQFFSYLEKFFLTVKSICDYIVKHPEKILPAWKEFHKYNPNVPYRQFIRENEAALEQTSKYGNTLGKIASIISYATLAVDVVSVWCDNYKSGSKNWISDSVVDSAYIGLRFGISAGLTALCSLIPIPVVGSFIGFGVSIGVDYIIQWLVEDTGFINEAKNWAADVGQAITDGWNNFCNGWQWFWGFSWI